MILSTHAVVGATVATLVPSHPVLGFMMGFGSHFILDSIPHWDYALKSKKKNVQNKMDADLIIGKDFYIDLIKIGCDAFLGLIFAILFFGIFNQYSLILILCGAIGGMLPDFLQFVYFKWRHQPLISLQKFHIWIHAKKRLDNRPIFGMLSQLLVIIIVILFIKII